VSPNITVVDTFTPLTYHAENSRWVEISRGLDGVEIRWDTIGWEPEVHEQVTVSLDLAGGITITSTNDSSLTLYDRAIRAVTGIAGDAAANWSSTARGHANSSGTVGVQLAYIDSDPCSDLCEY
jgi:hypothetical protein